MKKIHLKCLMLFAFMTLNSFVFGQEAEVIVDQPDAIDKLLDYKKDIKTLDVYKIQIYWSNDSFKADKAQSEFINKYAIRPIIMKYQTPNYKVWVGNFRDRLEADRALIRIRKNFPRAFIFQPKEDK